MLDISSKKVKTIYSGILPKGGHEIDFKTVGLSDGIYILKIRYENRFETIRVIVQKKK
ncbi:MAG: hypothetical protein GXO86_06435 [Chlorobi bacterium]|nr:hypothetical protein [Chlorobiota bacterium]